MNLESAFFIFEKEKRIVMKKYILLFLLFFIGKNAFAQNLPPIIQNLTATTDFSNNTITLSFDLEDQENSDVEITLRASSDGGETFAVFNTEATGDVGFPISVGTGKEIVWTPSNFSPPYQIELSADDLQIVDIQALVNQVDSNRLSNDLTNLEGVRHRITGATHLQNVKNIIESHFENEGLEIESYEWEADNYTAKNIIGKIKGKSDAPSVYIIDGHYDTVDDSPGADDNATAVAGVMEAARILSKYGFDHTIKFIGFDLEEEGLVGSLNYVGSSVANGEPLSGVVNLEMIGYYDDAPNTQMFPALFESAFPDAHALLEADSFRGNFITNVGFVSFTALQDSFQSIANEYVPELKVINLTATNFTDLQNQALLRSDHASFWFLNRPAIMLTDGAEFRNPNYHSENDLKETLDMEFMSNVVKAAIATIARLGGIRNCTTARVDIASSVDELNCDFNIFPNPTRDFLRVEFGDCEWRNFEVEFFDVNGVSVLWEKIMSPPGNNFTVSLESLSEGIYFMKVSVEGKTWSEKIIKR